jgi:SecD/SecF fusion protein
MVIIPVILVGILTPILFKNLKFGLDLQGGFEVLYEVESLNGDTLTTDMVDSTYKKISRRIDEYGVSEPVIQIEGDNRIRVQLAGVKSPEEARKNLSQVASLTFRDTSDNLLMTADVIKGAKVGTDSNGLPAVSLQVKDKTKFYEVTKKISNQSDNRIVIWVDFEEGVNSFSTDADTCGTEGSRCLSAAYVGEAFSSDVIIQGSFTQDQVKSLVSNINSGSLPTKLTEISSKTVDASFGENSLNKTFTAGAIGLVLVILFMILAYRFAGFLASIGLIVYTFLTFLVFWLVGGVLTLPGIAAMILGIGMAVDANVINFARIKDELQAGKSFQEAYRLGNKNSLITVIDANITTFIAAIILFVFGESSIKGFATMLMISIIITLLVMVILTRYVTSKFVQSNHFEGKENFFIGKTKKENKIDKIDFVKNRKKFVAIPLIIFIVGTLSLCTSGLNLGIDFKGGTSITINTETKITEDQIKKDIEKLEYQLSSFSKDSDTIYTMIIDNTLSEDEVLSTTSYFQETYDASVDIGVVSNRVKQDLVKNAIFSLVIAIIGIVAYVSIRFTFNYAIGGIVALLHDALIVVFVFSIFRLEVTTIFIAAILSILGYSINDTIVLFDRIRENKKKLYKDKIKNKEELKEIVNISIRGTMKRNIFTSVTTLVPVICLLIFGSHEIFTFNIAMLVGLLAGSYSSLFIACFVWTALEKRQIGKPKKKKWYEFDEKEELKVKGVNS